MDHSILAHWKALLLLFAIIAIINGMPSPGSNNAPNHWIYRWAFNSLHLFTGQIFRVANTIPSIKNLLGGGSNGNASANGTTGKPA